MNELFRQRQQYLVTSNGLNKKPNKNKYLKGNKKKQELDRRLEELSAENDTLLSGKNVLLSSASSPDVDPDALETFSDEENNKRINDPLFQNRGKDIIQSFSNKDNNNKKTFE